MNEFDKKDWEREEISGLEELLRPETDSKAPESEGTPEPSPTGEPADPAATAPEPETETETPAPEAEVENETPAPEPEAGAPASEPPAPKEEPPTAARPEAGGTFYQGGGGYYTPPGQPQGGAWQGQQVPPYGGQPYPNNPYQNHPYGPGWQQGYPGPRTTGWQQPAWGYPGTTGWGQPQQGANPWQAGGYRPQNPAQPGQWQGAAAPETPKKRHRVLKGFLVLLGVMLALAVISMAGYGIYAAATGDNPLAEPENGLLPPAASSSGGNSVPDVSLKDKPGTGADNYDDSARDGGLSNTKIYKKVSPSVVAIVVSDGNGLYGQKGLGSGIIMSEDGYIITNAHLTENIVNFEVILSDGETSYKAQVVGIDTRNDLAVLKIDAKGLTPAEFGNSDETEVGERVCVIGSPMALNFQNTFTVGYVSALNRSVKVNNNTINFIQTDAAINPGNSGGPLINAFGQVIGISSAKFADMEYEGMCFAIPISDAMPIVRELIANGKVTGRAVLGITAVAVKATEAEYYEIPLGLWVNSVNPGTDIEAKGVKEGDIITHIAGEPIYSIDACSRILGRYQPGDTVEVTVFRRESTVNDTTFTVEVVLQSS